MIRKISELADIIGITEETLKRWIKDGKIPVTSKKGLCEFDSGALKKWAKGSKIAINLKLSSEEQTTKDHAHIFSRAILKGIVTSLSGISSVEESLLAISGKITCFLHESSPDFIYNALTEREKIRSTGIGKGIAIPHPLKPMPDLFPESIVSVFFIQEPIDFGASDDIPVSVMFAVFASSQHEHLAIISSLSLCLKTDGFLSFLSSRPDKDKLAAWINSAETRIKAQK